MIGKLSRRTFLAGAGGVALSPLAAPHVARAQASTLRITTWGGKWGDTMRAKVLPAFEREFKCKVEADQAFPFIPKLQASARNAPVYDVLHANSNEQWGALAEGLVMDKVSARDVPNLKDVYPYAISDRIVGVSIFTSAIGLAHRSDAGIQVASWKDLADPRYAGKRGGYLIPVNALGQAHFLMLGKLYGRGLQDLDAAYKALEGLKPIKLVDFVGPIERMLINGEIQVGVLHDSGVYRYDGQNQPIAFTAPSEGVLALEQVLSVTPGSGVKELAYAYIDFMLRPDVQKTLVEAVWYSPANRKVELEPRFAEKLYTTPEKVARLIQVDWRWYNERKDEIDARVARIMRA